MKVKELLSETWTQKYKSSINCSHPKGFSQKAHCVGKKKHNESIEMESVCPDCGMCETHGDHMMEVKQRLDAKCWKGKHKEGTKIKGGIRVNNCVPNESVAEGEKKTMSRAAKGVMKYGKDGMKALAKAGRDGASDEKLDNIRDKHDKYDESIDELSRVLELSGLNLTADEQFDIIEEMVEQLALEHGVDPEVIWEDFESVEDAELLESAAWRRSEGKSKAGGLNAKGVASYRRENPGSKLQTAVTTKPSKLKAGSKAAKRRKSFCARMGGVKGPMKKPNGKPTRKALALRKWNC